MNKQGKLINGKVTGNNIIGWTKTILSDDTERLGATVNPVGGCFHRCQWIMPVYGLGIESQIRGLQRKKNEPFSSIGNAGGVRL